jgi:hypothetical protein
MVSNFFSAHQNPGSGSDQISGKQINMRQINWAFFKGKKLNKYFVRNSLLTVAVVSFEIF